MRRGGGVSFAGIGRGEKNAENAWEDPTEKTRNYLININNELKIRKIEN